MDQRTRTQLPLLPSLLRAVQQQRKDAEELITTARDLPAGDRFTAGGQDFQRCHPGSLRPRLRHRPDQPHPAQPHS